ncbi:MAG: sulfotransferase family 2 domain-containing protein [Pseudomonadota bacterium]
MLISVHIRKCAGTTLRHALAAGFEDRVLFDYGDQIGSTWPSSVARRHSSLTKAKSKAADLISRYSIIHGHFYRQKYDFLDTPKRYVTFLRDPVVRVVSNYAYLKRKPQRRHPDALIVHALGFSLAEFAAHPDNRNLQRQFLQSSDLGEFSFVGLVERYEDSLTRLSAEIGVALPAIAPQNTNAAANSGYHLSPRDRRLIEDLNRDDMRLYERAHARFENLSAA